MYILNDLFCDHALLSPTTICGLHCGMGVLDCALCQAYNVCVIMASCERCPQGGAEERIACPRGEGEAPAMGSIKRGRVRHPATGYKRALSTSWKIAARRLPPRPSDGGQMAKIQRFVKEPNQHECFCYCTNGSSFPFSCQCPREDLREAMEVLRAALHPSVAHRPGAHGLRPAVPSRGAGVAGRHLSAVSGLDPL